MVEREDIKKKEGRRVGDAEGEGGRGEKGRERGPGRSKEAV